MFFVLRQQIRINSQHERQASELEDKVLDLPVTLSKLGEADPYLRHLVHLSKDETIRYAKGAVDGEIVVRARNILQEGIEIFKQAKPGDKIISTNYWSAYSTPQSDVFRRTSFDLAANGIDFTRVFIEGDTFTSEEKKRQREEMDRQKDHIKVRFVKESLLPPEARKNFAVIYDRIYFYTSSTSKGWLFDELRFITRREELDKAKALAETIIRLSEEYK